MKSLAMMTIVAAAACGGPAKHVEPPPSNTTGDASAPVTMEEDVVQGDVSANEPPAPTADPAPPSTPGARDKPAIRAVVRTAIKKISYCYERRLLVTPGLAGTTTVAFTIEADGTVSSSAASGFDPDVDNCVASVIGDLRFAVDPIGAATAVNYPFTFK